MILGIVVLIILFIGYDWYISSKAVNSLKNPSTQTSAQLDQAAVQSRDAKRLSDVRQIKTVLDLYKQTKNQYPDSLAQAAEIYGPVANAKAPVPADSPCTDTDNNYVYTSLSGSYTLTFCLGSKVLDSTTNQYYSPGVHTLTPNGIQ